MLATGGLRAAIVENAFRLQPQSTPINCVGRIYLTNTNCLPVVWSVTSGSATVNHISNTEAEIVSSVAGTVTVKATAGNFDSDQTFTIRADAPTIEQVSFSNGFDENGYFCSSNRGNEFHYQLSSTTGNASLEYRIRKWSNQSIVYTHPYPIPAGPPIHVNHTPTPGWYVFEIQVTNGCGSTPWTGFDVEFVNCSQRGGRESFSVQVSPNPAFSDIYVKTENENPEVAALKASEKVSFVLYDFNRAHAVKQWSFLNDQKQHKLNVAGVKPGQYILVVTKDKHRQSIKVIIK